MMTGNAVIFEKFTLQGFGPYREPTTFIFTEGMNGYIAANETGKTSMMAGLLATIFGLTHRQRSVSAFNLDRFRNWDQPSACRGELFLSSNGKRYQIQRDFDTHQVSLWEFEDNKELRELLVEGQHNPEARRPLKRYEELLHSILGISSQELFEDTFFVAQPLPEVSQISADLQCLLAGGKGASFQDALNSLLTNLKKLTKYTGPNHRGVTGRNMGKDGTLELSVENIKTLREQISSGHQNADTLNEVQIMVGKIEEELRSARKDLEQKINAKQAWSGWQLMASQYTASAKERGTLETAIGEVIKLKEELQSLEKDLNAGYPEFANAHPELEEGLEKLIFLNQEIGKTSKSNDGLIISQKQRLGRLAELDSSINQYQGWDMLGSDPVEKIKGTRRSAVSCLKTWETFLAERKKLTELNQQLSDTYSTFGEATEKELEVIININQTQMALASDTEKAEQAYLNGKQKIKDWEDAKREHHTKFANLMELSNQASTAAGEKWKLLKKQRELEKQLQDMPEPPKASVGVRVVGGGILSALAFFLLGPDNLVMLIMGIILAFLIGAIGVGLLYGRVKASDINNHQANQHELEAVKGEMTKYDQQLGSFSLADDMELARLVERLKNYEEENRRIKAIKEEMLAIDLTILDKCWQEKKEAQSSFYAKIKKFTDSYVDVQEAYNTWKYLTKEQNRLDTSTTQFAEEIFGCKAEVVEEADPNSDTTDEQWKELAVLIKILLGKELYGSINNIDALINQMIQITDSWWKDRENEAIELVKARAERETLNHQLGMTGKRIEEEKEKEKQLLDELHKWEDIFRTVLLANQDSPELALQKYKMHQQHIRLKEDANTKLETLLNNYQVKDIGQLLAKYERIKDQVTSRMLQWQQHIAKYQGLPDPEHADDPELVQLKMKEMDATIQTLGDKVSLLDMQRSELYRQMARLEGINPINIAAAEIELKELKEEQALVEQQADALTLAYHELGAAITEYSQTYQERLEEKATGYFREISGVHDRRIMLDDQLNIEIMEKGRLITTESLSKGARDQMYLSLRFAVADLIAENVRLPLVFDDPFTSTDAARLERIRKIFEEQSSERQFFILAHSDHYLKWGKTINIKE